ncbi:TonB-dependent receptor [Caulobacter hibisci]|uniref:TonB-dependent receptor n=1 Tax=Caulobacter hibisci TaxID=2035993 RepID=A0ABS0T1C7_9CAUL|nr:TonB-dependent receptor [Caulobacter hibisci]MBI1685683.1 TonB-dependent receptor [Caulobacter hibisci]
MKKPSVAGVASVRRRALSATAVAGLAGLTLGAGVAHAAEADAAAPIATASAAAPATDATDVSGVDVNGKKQARPQSEKFTAPLLDTPKTVNIITTDALQQQAITSLADAFRTVPGITLESGEGGSPAGDRPRIRGMDSTSDIFVDGIRDAGGQSREVFALEQIEIVKGPSSAYSGRGSTGGSVNLVSKVARLGDSKAATLTLGDNATRRVAVDVNEQVTDGIALRLNALYHENEVNGRDYVHGDRWGAAASVGFGLNGPTRLTLDYYHLESSELPDYGIPYVPTTVGSVTYGKMLTGHDDKFYGLTSRDFRDTSADVSTLRFQQDLGGTWKFSTSTRYGRTTNAYVATNPDDTKRNVPNGYLFRSSKNRNTLTTTTANATTVTGEFNAGGFKHSVAIGTEMAQEQTHSQGYVISSPGVTSGTLVNGNLGCNASRLGAAYGYNCTTLDNPNANDPWIGTVTRSPTFTRTIVRTRAVFAFDTIELNEHWLVNLGVRHDDYTNKYLGGTISASGVTPTSSLRNESRFWNYQAGVVYKPVENASIYASYGSSSNPSGEGAGDTSSVAATTVNLDPEQNDSYELGAKWNLLDNRLNLTGAIFRTDKTNARVIDTDGSTQLVGQTRAQGVELGVGGQLTRAWSVTAGYTYTDSEVIDGGFTVTTIPATSTTPATTVATPSVNNGKMFPNTPKHAFSGWTSYNFGRAFTIGGGASYMSKRYANAANTYEVPSYWRYDAMASWNVNQNASLQLNLQNLTDERYALKPYSTHMVQIAEGRTALLTLNLKY